MDEEPLLKLTMQNSLSKRFDFTSKIKEDFDLFLQTKNDIFKIISDKRDQKQLQTYEDESKDLKGPRVISEYDRTAMALIPNILEASNLKFESMAKYKVLKDSDLLTYDQITQRALRRRSVRRIVLESEIEDISELESQINGCKSSSERSSKIGYWKDINTSDDLYKNAIIVKKWRQDLKKKERRDIKEDVANIQKIKNKLEHKKIQKQAHQIKKKEQSIDYSRHEEQNKEKITKIQKAHNIEMRNIKNLAIQYAIEYFKDKSQSLNKIYTSEINILYEQYEKVRSRLLLKDSKIMQLTKIAFRQEQIISELREYYEETLKEVIGKTMKFQSQIVNLHQMKYQKPLTEIQLNNPFFLYNSYKNLTAPQIESNKNLEFKIKYMQMKAQNTQILSEMESLNEVCTLCLSEQSFFRNKIDQLEENTQNLKVAFQNEKEKLLETIEILKIANDQERIQMKVNAQKLKDFVKIEASIKDSIIDKYKILFEEKAEDLKQVKMVLKTPRLYQKYQEQLKKTADSFQQEYLIKRKLMRDLQQTSIDTNSSFLGSLQGSNMTKREKSQDGGSNFRKDSASRYSMSRVMKSRNEFKQINNSIDAINMYPSKIKFALDSLTSSKGSRGAFDMNRTVQTMKVEEDLIFSEEQRSLNSMTINVVQAYDRPHTGDFFDKSHKKHRRNFQIRSGSTRNTTATVQSVLLTKLQELKKKQELQQMSYSSRQQFLWTNGNDFKKMLTGAGSQQTALNQNSSQVMDQKIEENIQKREINKLRASYHESLTNHQRSRKYKEHINLNCAERCITNYRDDDLTRNEMGCLINCYNKYYRYLAFANTMYTFMVYDDRTNEFFNNQDEEENLAKLMVEDKGPKDK